MNVVVLFTFSLLCAFLSSAQVLNRERNCTCGFLNSQSNDLFTDSIIVYFNETTTIPDDFIAEGYAQKSKKDWNAIYREAADPLNVRLNDTESVQLFVQAPSKDHLVKGASLRTKRRDIQHGSFRTLIRSPGPKARGSAMSMMWKYNETEVTELSIMNTNDPSDAWIGTFVNNEFTTRDLGTNYTQLLEQATANRNYTTLGGGLSNGSVDAWDYTEYRIDWTSDYINFYVGGNLTREVLHRDNHGMPSVPSAMFFKHWATGNRFSMEGPPLRESVAEVGWIRMFFNSSSMDEESREDFVTRCPLTEACSMDDITLRGSTEYDAEIATRMWEQKSRKSSKRKPALWVSMICIGITTILLIHTFIKRIVPRINRDIRVPPTLSSASSITDDREKNTYRSSGCTIASSNTSHHGSSTSSDKRDSKDDLAIEKIDPSPGTPVVGSATPPHYHSPHNSTLFDSRAATPFNSNFNTTREDLRPPLPGQDSQLTLAGPIYPSAPVQAASTTTSVHNYRATDKITMNTVTESAMPAPRMSSHRPPSRQRIDHLAGLTALCSLVVTVMHFGLTFVPAIVIPGAPQHNGSEYWAQKIIAPFLLNQMWLGVFFTTSVRFLTASYLRTGKLEDIAKAAVRRTPRLMMPVAAIALLEYFCIDVGATKYLEYTPSLTWSTWPYVTRYNNFGQYVSEILELVFLIPNAVPQITLHYCTGVLWTIAVQLQGSWLVLTGAIVVREIRTPWKRMAFYAFCLVNHWYAQSWGTYLWLGLLLTDLDITYAYKSYLNKRPGVYYPVITFCWLCVAAGFAVNVVPNWAPTDFNFATVEANLHPDPTTGERLGNTDKAGYPPYYTPRLNGLLFAGGMQAIVELSGAVQWFLSTPPFLLMFPHVFTIYLLHGLVFWTWGSWLLVFLAERDFSYGVNVAVVGVTSYALLFLCLPIVTPILEALGKDVTALIWMMATKKSPERRRTLFPFPEDLFTGREVNLKGKKADVESGNGSVRGDVALGVSKGKGKEPEVEIHAFSCEEERKGAV